MFIVQLIGALIVLILEAFNKTDFRQQLIYFYYRFGTSLHNSVNPLIPIEHSRTLIYQIKSYYIQPKPQYTMYLDYLIDDTILYWYRVDCAIKVHLESNFIYILTYNNILSIFEYENNDILDVEFYGFNKNVQFHLKYETKIIGEYYKSQLVGQELYIIMQNNLQYLHYLYIDDNLLLFQLSSEDKTIQFYTNQQYLLIVSQTHDFNYLASIKNYSDISQLFRLFHKGQYMINIPIQKSRNKEIIDFISVIIDDYSSKISFIQYQVSVNNGFGSSSTIFQEDASKLLDSQFRDNWLEFIKYTAYQDKIYIIIGQQHYFIRPFILGHDRYEIIKIQTQMIEQKSKIVNLKMNHQDIIIQSYNYQNDNNQYYYLNLTQLQDNQDLLLKLEDVRQSIHKIGILDYIILNQQYYSEIIFILQSGDILVGQLQHPLYYQLFQWTFGLQGSMQKFGIPIFVTAVMELIRQGRQQQN